MSHSLFGSMNPLFLVTIAFSLLHIGIGLLYVFEELFLSEMLAGWLIALGNYIAQGLLSQVRKIQNSSQNFMKSLGWNGVRAGFFLMFAVLFILSGHFQIEPFIYALFGSYFLFLFYNILSMHLNSLKS
jgi:hypothetical protein